MKKDKIQPKDIKRNQIIDALKGLGIFLVVLGHTIQFNTSNFDNDILFRIIYSFHMPLFIFLSGYLGFYSLENKALFPVFKKKVRTLVIPFLAWYFIIGYLISGLYKTVDIGIYTNRLIISPDYGLWFLWTLFLCFVVVLLLLYIQRRLRISKDIYILSLFVLSIFIIKYIPVSAFGMGLLKWHLPFFISGYLISKYKSKVIPYLNYIKELSFVGFLSLIIFWYRISPVPFSGLILKYIPNLMDNINDFYKYIVAFFGIAVVYFIIVQLKNTRFFNLMGWIGRYSFDIYVLQFFLILVIEHNPVSGLLTDIIYIVFSIISTALSILIAKFIFRQSRILSFLFIGQ